jgi:hypothetical protein
MRLGQKLAVSAAAVMFSATAAMAADPIIIPPPAPPPPAPVMYDWGGFYGGIHTGALIVYGGGVQAGFNIQRGKVVFGFGGRFGGTAFTGTTLLYAGAGGRIGVAAGDTGNWLIYANGAGGIIFTPGVGSAPFALFGGGVEYGVTPRVSVFGEINGAAVFGGGGGCCFGMVAGGVNFHFGN